MCDIPTYVYFCSDCSIEFETVQSMNDLACTDCPACMKVTNWRIPQLCGIIDSSPKTLGALADYNRKHMGQYNYEQTLKNMADDRKQLAKYKGVMPEKATNVEQPEKTTTWYRPDMDVPDTKLLNASPEALNRYIETGKRPAGTT